MKIDLQTAMTLVNLTKSYLGHLNHTGDFNYEATQASLNMLQNHLQDWAEGVDNEEA